MMVNGKVDSLFSYFFFFACSYNIGCFLMFTLRPNNASLLFKIEGIRREKKNLNS